MKYKGSFKIYHKGMKYSDGVFCYSPSGTIFMSNGFNIGEFIPPEPAKVNDQAYAPLADVIQEPFNIRAMLPDNFPITRFRITGMVFSGEKLVVNYTDWYAAGGNQYYTTMIISNPFDLPNCTIDWQYSMDGIARKSGYMYNVPQEHRELFGGDIASFAPRESIISRHDLGPSCMGFSLSDLTQVEFTGNILMDYPFYEKDESGLPKLFYDKSQYSEEIVSEQGFNDRYINNVDMPSDIAEHTYNTYWTAKSRVACAFARGDYMYVVTPMAGGTRKPFYEAQIPEPVTQGIGYKGSIKKWVYNHDTNEYVENDGDKGYGTAIEDDAYTSVFTFSLSDLEEVRSGSLEPHEVRPISQELHKQPVESTLRDGIHSLPRHGAYIDGNLVISYDNQGLVGNYGQVPLFNVFGFDENDQPQQEPEKKYIQIEVSEEIHDMLKSKTIKLDIS